ncbi:MAG TPA: glutamyl-tRNA reductase [Acidimicrobiales bacterium]|nr:glutamyl-tRNA reductase [Acidimicrobiales bacterium]
MSVVVVGVNHRTVPLEALEPLLISPVDLPKALADLAARPHLQEVVVVSTCMRTEVYAVVSRFHGAMADIREFLATWSGRPPEAFSDHLYAYFDEAAVSHLFRVSAGLDSASLGEPEILGQVKSAAESARKEGVSGSTLASAFRHALIVGKRARTETGISRGTTSLSYAAVEMAVDVLGDLAGKRALVLGAGEVGESTVRALANAPGSPEVVVVNRTRARAERVAGEVGAMVVAWAAAKDALAGADIVVCCTAGDPSVMGTDLLGTDVLEAGLAARPERPMLIVDLSVPRNVGPEVGRLAGVTLVDMDRLSKYVTLRAEDRRAEIPAVESIVAEELHRYASSVAERSVAPLVALARERAEELRRQELGRVRKRLEGLDTDQLEAVELVTRRLVAKLLHEPTVNLKAAAGTARGDALAAAFRELFGLEP